MKAIIVPVSEKFCLTIEEAAAYFGIGEGKIRKLISSNPDAAYVLRNGRKPCKSLRAIEKEIQNSINNNYNYFDTSRLTLNSIVDRYLDSKINTRESTEQNYKYMYDRFVRNSLGRVKLCDLRYSDIKGHYTELIKKQSIKVATLDTLQNVIHPALTMAVRDRIIPNNPSDRVIGDVKKLLLKLCEASTNAQVIDGYSGFIIQNRFGTFQNAKGINDALKRIVADYNQQEQKKAAHENRKPILLPHISCHTFRHTFCVRLCEELDKIDAIQSIMGHSDIRTTLQIYNEVNKDRQKASMELLEGKIRIV